jgi:predicted TIM-barrel fold metal-dependent hydrolase
MRELTIDSDHHLPRATLGTIMPFLPLRWQKYLSTGGSPDRLGHRLPEPPYQPQDPAPAGAAQVDEVRRLLDERAIEAAVLNPRDAAGVGALANPDLGAAAAAATNDWLAKTWLDVDPRFKGSIVLSLRDPKQAAAEIKRWAPDPRMVQVLLAWPPGLLSDRSFLPVLEAAAEAGLVLTLEAGGAYAGANKAMTPVGFPLSELEFRLGAEYTAQPHLAALILNGVFERLPGLKVVFSGFGIAWLPSLLWRMDDEYERGRFGRAELPRPPSEYVRSSVRFTTQTVELPAQTADLVTLLSLVGGQELLLYASGDPKDPVPDAFADALPSGWRPAVLRENALAVYAGRAQLAGTRP